LHFPLWEKDKYVLTKELKQAKEERGFLPDLKDWVSTSSIG
jgi:hypothetical protein